MTKTYIRQLVKALTVDPKIGFRNERWDWEYVANRFGVDVDDLTAENHRFRWLVEQKLVNSNYELSGRLEASLLLSEAYS